MSIASSARRARELKIHQPHRVAAMLRHTGGRTLVELCQLAGRTAEVRFSDYGCSGQRISWDERVTIVEFTGIRHVEIDDGEGRIVGTIPRPSFFCQVGFHHMADVTVDQFHNIYPLDRVAQQCRFCRHDTGGHHNGCPYMRPNLEDATQTYYDGREAFHEWNYPFYNGGCHRPLPEWVNTNPTYYLGFAEAQWDWYQNNPE